MTPFTKVVTAGEFFVGFGGEALGFLELKLPVLSGGEFLGGWFPGSGVSWFV